MENTAYPVVAVEILVKQNHCLCGSVILMYYYENNILQSVLARRMCITDNVCITLLWYLVSLVFYLCHLVCQSYWSICALVTFNLESGSNNAWIKFNANMTGMYRVHYDDADWQALIDQLKQDHSVSNQIELTFAFVTSVHCVVAFS